MGRVGGFVGFGLPGEGRFVDFERNSLDELPVSGYGLAVLDNDDIADDDIAPGNALHGSVAQDGDGNVVADPVEPAEPPLGVPLEKKPDASGEDDGADDADGFGKIMADGPDDERKHGSSEQHFDNGVAELVEQQHPRRLLARRCDDVDAVEPPAFGDLGSGQTDGTGRNHNELFFSSGNCRDDASSRTAIKSRMVKAMSDDPP